MQLQTCLALHCGRVQFVADARVSTRAFHCRVVAHAFAPGRTRPTLLLEACVPRAIQAGNIEATRVGLFKCPSCVRGQMRTR
eukprot:4088235-Alexandrium_andersonii.AAC.1